MSDAYGVDDPVEEEANDFVSEYLDENILEMDIPEVIDEDYEDEDEDYDDDEYDETWYLNSVIMCCHFSTFAKKTYMNGKNHLSQSIAATDD